MRSWARLAWLALGLSVVVAYSVAATAQTPRRSTYQQITVSTTALTISTATTAGMDGCQIRVETDSVRYRQDATAPTSSVGMPLGAGDALHIERIQDVENTRFIRSGSSDSTLNVLCWQQ